MGNNVAGEGEVWRWDGTEWIKVGGDGYGWANSTYEYVYSLHVFNGVLYAGLGLTAGDAEVWQYNGGTSWTQIGGTASGNWGTSGFEGVYSLTDDGTYLYAGLGITGGDNEFWRYSGAGTNWTKVGGDAIDLDGSGPGRSSFTNTHLSVSTLVYYNGILFAGLRSNSTTRTGEVWGLTGNDWELLGDSNVRKSWGDRGPRTVGVMVSSMDYLYAGIGNTDAGNAKVWRFDGTKWEIIGGSGFERVNNITIYNNKLYATLGVNSGDAEVWEYGGSGTSWTKVGGDTVNNSWGNSTTYEIVESAVVYNNNKLYVGLGNGIDDAEVWAYDGSTWEQVGGDNIANSWSTYTRARTLAVYNGELYAGLGYGAGYGEVWKYNGITWTKVGGNGPGWNADMSRLKVLVRIV